MTQTLPTRDELLAQNGVLLIVDDILPPSGPVAKGGTPTVRPMELGLFIAIDQDSRVYAFNGHVDLGTGIRTSLTQIVAEELDLQMDQVTMILGDTERAPNQGATIASATLQISAIPLRNAAAEARRYLLQQAAQRWAVAVESLVIESGAIKAQDGRELTFGQLLVDQRVELRISGNAPLKRLEDYKLVGQGAARVDIPGKATGELTYVHDMRLPDMLHGRVVRPPYAGYDTGEFVGTSLLDVDESSIAHIPGIVRVVVIRDFVGIVAMREEQAAKAARELKVTWKPWQHQLPDMGNIEQAIRDNP
ncbi:MAG: aldehyde dehydrogenase, partial [Pseudomonas sp.]|uniref:molybdopterin cofactor-binding domain-containing protein n=1 Tax=Pseudomonas sp. TaxID=306 RepID=UPI0012067B97